MEHQHLTSVDIVYGYGGPSQTYTWTGSLAQGASVTVNLPTVTRSERFLHVYCFYGSAEWVCRSEPGQ